MTGGGPGQAAQWPAAREQPLEAESIPNKGRCRRAHDSRRRGKDFTRSPLARSAPSIGIRIFMASARSTPVGRARTHVLFVLACFGQRLRRAGRWADVVADLPWVTDRHADPGRGNRPSAVPLLTLVTLECSTVDIAMSVNPRGRWGLFACAATRRASWLENAITIAPCRPSGRRAAFRIHWFHSASARRAALP